ncbi:MAG: hypothetical protein AB8B95_14380 [Pseudohongiellaceae bacterium]
MAGAEDPLLPLSIKVHDAMKLRNKNLRLERYEHGYHDIGLAPQDHDRPDEPDGEQLMQEP